MKTKRKLEAHVRWMIRRDLSEVDRIEQLSFESPWSQEDFKEQMSSQNCICMTATQDQKVLGYIVFELHADRFHLVNLAVDPEYRRSKIAHQMVKVLFKKLGRRNRRRITLCVGEDNLGAQVFFRKLGFKATQVLRGHWNEGSIDAYSFAYESAPVELEQRVLQFEDLIEGGVYTFRCRRGDRLQGEFLGFRSLGRGLPLGIRMRVNANAIGYLPTNEVTSISTTNAC